MLDVHGGGGAWTGNVEVGEGDIQWVVVRDKVDHCSGNGHQQTQEEGQSPPEVI